MLSEEFEEELGKWENPLLYPKTKWILSCKNFKRIFTHQEFR